jgi:hypothetical protein
VTPASRSQGARLLPVVLALLALAACTTDSRASTATTTSTTAPSGTHAEHGAPPGPPAGAIGPTRWEGPQGRVGQFVVHCSFSHAAPDDPIVHYGKPGAAHLHDFYGATGTDSGSTAADLLEGGTTCDKSVDTAGYWQPALSDHGQVVEPHMISAYYRAAPGVDPQDVEPMPLGLALIAGDQTATAPQPGEATGWACGVSTHLSDDPPTCPEGAPLHLVLTFQDCWDGDYLDSEDHSSHAAYSEDGACPDSHPVHLPQLTVSVAFPISGPGHELSLASGSIYSAHGDFLNGWQPDGMAREVDACIHRGAVCDLASNRSEEPLFSFGA